MARKRNSFQVIVGLILFVASAIAIYYGYLESQSFESGLSEAFRGTVTDRSKIMMGDGIAGVLAGAFLLMRKSPRR